MAENIPSWMLTAIYSFVMIVWAFLADRKFKKYVSDNPFGDYEQPRTAATLGVLGTFIGIACGLCFFDTQAIDKSITNLLSGMETAFFTSILGMGISLYFKDIQADAQKNAEHVKPDSDISDLIDYLKKSDAEKNKSLTALKNSLVGEGDSTVIGQMKIIKSDIRDEFKVLDKILRDNNENIIREFQDFGKTLAENNSKAFIEALNETMRDFNQKLTEQFGENFKQLNIAVGRLLEWQENYKTTVEDITETLKKTFEGIDATEKSISEIEKSSVEMIDSAEQIRNLIVSANLYEQKLESILSEIQTLATNTQNSIQSLSQEMTNTIDKTNELNEQMANLGNTVITKLDGVAYETVDALKSVSKQIDETSKSQRAIIESEIQVTKDAIQKAATALSEDTFQITKKVSDGLEKMMQTNNENLKTATENLNKNLEQKLKESIEKFGNSMYLVSEKFVGDYEPLTEKLAKLVRLAEGIERRRLP